MDVPAPSSGVRTSKPVLRSCEVHHTTVLSRFRGGTTVAGQMPDVFISYRREDSEGLAGRIFDQLNAAFPGRIIIDIDAIPFGVDFRESITKSLSRCSVLIAIIGPRWFEFQGPDGTRRLDNPNDWVRLEIEAALAHPGVWVIPLLLDDTPMPRAEHLPEGLAPLAYRNALRVDSGRDFHHHMDDLKDALTTLLAADAPAAVPGPPRAVPVPAGIVSEEASTADDPQPTPNTDSRSGHRLSSPSSSVAETAQSGAENVARPWNRRRLYLLGGVACALLVAGGAAALNGLYNTLFIINGSTPEGHNQDPVSPLQLTAVAARPASSSPTFTNRVGYIGNSNSLFKIELSKAEVTEADGHRSAVISSRISNMSNTDYSLVDVKNPSLLAADGTIITARWKINSPIPGGGTTPVDIVASVTKTFKFEGMSLVFGNNASNQTILPLDESVKVTTFSPVLGVGKGKTAAGGSGTVVTITDGILHDDFTNGSKDKYQLELKVDVSYTHPSNAGGSYEEAIFTLTAPDGTSSSSESSGVFSSNDSTVIDTGKTSRLGLKFMIPSTYYGEYKLTVNSRRVSVYKDPGAIHPVLTFEVAQVP